MTASGVMAHVTIYLASKVASALEPIILKALEAHIWHRQKDPALTMS